MKTLVAYYSRTGNTKKVAETIAQKLNADIDEIVDKTDRSGILGWLRAGRDAAFKRPTAIEYKQKPGEYELVIIGTPVWAGSVTPAVRQYLADNRCENVAFFCTFGGSAGKVLAGLEELSAAPKATLGLKDRTIAGSAGSIDEFCDTIGKQ